MAYNIQPQTHGAHLVEVYITAEINGSTVMIAVEILRMAIQRLLMKPKQKSERKTGKFGEIFMSL